MTPPDPMQVATAEHGLVRLFTTPLDPEDASAITAQNVHRLLGQNVAIDPRRVEVVPSKSLEGLGLTEYLEQGYGIASGDLEGKAAALNALNGLIILIPSAAFMGKAQSLDPNPALRFIGVFREPDAEAPSMMGQHAGAMGAVTPKPGPAPFPGHGRSWVGALGALLIAAALVLWLVL